VSATTSEPSRPVRGADGRGPDEVKKAEPGPSHLDPGLRARVRFLVSLFSDTADRFSENEGPRLGASFSYYAIFSIFPLLLLSVTVVGFFLGDSAPARERLLAALAQDGSVHEVLERTLTAMQESRGARGLSAAIGALSLLFGASGAFVELDAALNRIWCVPVRKSKGFVGTIRLFLQERLSGFAIVAGLGATILVSLVSSSLLTAFADRAKAQLEIPLWPALVKTAELALSIGILTAVFTAAFHFIPRSRPPIRVVIPGALLTTAFLSALKEIFAFYLSKLTSYSAYGMAGGVLALITWIYLTSMIILFGAQLTRIHGEKVGAVKHCEIPPST
jgi:membrane protein